jgi:hypothetical protein
MAGPAEVAKRRSLPTSREVVGKIERSYGALFANLRSAVVVAHWLVAVHETGVRRAINLTSPNHRSYDAHRARTARTLVRILTPDLHDEIPPERSECPAAPGVGWRKDEQGPGKSRLLPDGPLRILYCRPASPRLRCHSPALVRIEPVIPHCLLPFRRDVLDGGGEEVHSLEDLEVALGVPEGVLGFRL